MKVNVNVYVLNSCVVMYALTYDQSQNGGELLKRHSEREKKECASPEIVSRCV